MRTQAGECKSSPFPHAGKDRKPAAAYGYSVAMRVVFLLAIVASGLLVGGAWLSYRERSASERQRMQEKLVVDADQLSVGLSLPLWNFDYNQVGKILDSEMQDRNLYGVVVSQVDSVNANHVMIHARIRDGQWHPVPTAVDVFPNGMLVQERTITAMGEPVGHVKLIVTPRFMEQELRQRTIQTTLQTVLFGLLLIISLYHVLWWVVLRPLRHIERYATAVSSGGAPPAGVLAGRFHGELESLRVAIGEMVHLLHARLKALQEKETTLTAVFDSVPQNVYWKDAEGRFAGCNKVFARTVGLEEPGAIIGRRVQELPNQGEEIVAHQLDDLQVLRTGVSRVHAVESCRTASGEVVWLDVTKVPILDEEGTPFAVLGVSEDITGMKLAEEERVKLLEQLNQSQKLESIGRLAGGVAHDNNNMLTAILMHAELLREILGPGNPALRHIQAMEGAAERSTGLIRQLLAFSRKQVIEPKVVDLNELLGGFRASMSPLVGEDINFVFKPARELWPLRLDPTQVDQVLMNLVVNARDAMPTGGTLVIETSNVRIDDQYCQDHPWAVPGDYVLLTVSDTGVGMTPDLQEKIFDPFFTTKEVGKGTGLGLSTVFGIVKQNNGFIQVYSEPGLGATFKVYLPKFHGDDVPETEESGPEALCQGMGQILVVEDDESLREVIPHILDRLGFTYMMADTPEEALEIGRRPGTEIDVLLTDVVMPGMSGKELWEKFRVIRPDAQVVYMSGYTADVISMQGVLDSGVHFIQKPFSTAELGKKLRSVMRGVSVP